MLLLLNSFMKKRLTLRDVCPDVDEIWYNRCRQRRSKWCQK